MSFRLAKIILLFFLPALALPAFFILQQSQDVLAAENLAQECEISRIEQRCQGLPASECRKILEQCEAYYQEQSNKISADISKTESEKKTLKNKISGLAKTIKNLDYEISKSNLIIKDLKIQIQDTTSSIEKTSVQIDKLKIQLSTILRNIKEESEKPMIEVLFSENKVSDFFDNLVALEILDNKQKELLKDIKVLKTNLEDQKESLDSEKEGLEKTVKVQTLQKEQSSKTKKDQEYYLGITEQEYQKQLKEKADIAKKAAEIRARIFELIGVPKAPTFGEAVEIAKFVEKITGIRPAFLLAILQQESAIGRNVGQCYLSDSQTGAGVKINGGGAVSRVMKPSRDVGPFLTITGELGRDPYKTPVSCPMRFGYGGAMGPAQFIPSTWMNYRSKLQSVLGKPADPWNIRDAFLAAGMYLANFGAASRNRDTEWKAAMIYFSGSTTNKSYYWYANNVLKIADGFEADIKTIGQ